MLLGGWLRAFWCSCHRTYVFCVEYEFRTTKACFEDALARKLRDCYERPGRNLHAITAKKSDATVFRHIHWVTGPGFSAAGELLPAARLQDTQLRGIHLCFKWQRDMCTPAQPSFL